MWLLTPPRNTLSHYYYTVRLKKLFGETTGHGHTYHNQHAAVSVTVMSLSCMLVNDCVWHKQCVCVCVLSGCVTPCWLQFEVRVFGHCGGYIVRQCCLITILSSTVIVIIHIYTSGVQHCPMCSMYRTYIQCTYSIVRYVKQCSFQILLQSGQISIAKITKKFKGATPIILKVG